MAISKEHDGVRVEQEQAITEQESHGLLARDEQESFLEKCTSKDGSESQRLLSSSRYPLCLLPRDFFFQRIDPIVVLNSEVIIAQSIRLERETGCLHQPRAAIDQSTATRKQGSVAVTHVTETSRHRDAICDVAALHSSSQSLGVGSRWIKVSCSAQSLAAAA